jgi:hypothetical protein
MNAIYYRSVTMERTKKALAVRQGLLRDIKY